MTTTGSARSLARPAPAGADPAPRALGAAASRDDADRVAARPGAVRLRARDRELTRSQPVRDHAGDDVRGRREPAAARTSRPLGDGLHRAADLVGRPRAPVGRTHRGALPLLRHGDAARDVRGVVPLPARVRLRARAPRHDGRARRRVRLRPRRRAGAPVALGRRPRAVHQRARRGQHRVVADERGRARRDARAATCGSARPSRTPRSGWRSWRSTARSSASTPRSARRPDSARTSSSGWRSTSSRRRRIATALPGRREAGVEVERRFMRADGSVGWGLWQHSLVHDAGDAPAYWVSHVLDISARKGVERQLDYQAHHDPLTGLPNRTLFLQRLHELIAAGGDERRGAVRRPRQLQADQRLARPRRGRSPARRSWRSACGACSGPAT